MKLQRKLTNKEWDEIVKEGPGVRNYRGQKTLFWNGERLWDNDAGEYLVYDQEETQTWKVIVVLPGVEVIPVWTFNECKNVKMVIMADSVKRIEDDAFSCCETLVFVKLSRNLEFIGEGSFWGCESLTAIFIPPSCREIGRYAFRYCKKLIILNVPQATELGDNAIARTALIKAYYFEADHIGRYNSTREVNAWIKNINGNDEEYSLHRACSAFNPISDIISEIIKRQGLVSFQKENEIGITPLRYLEENPYANIDQQKLIKRYILEMMGGTV